MKYHKVWKKNSNFYVNTTFWYETLVQLSKLTLKAKVTEIFSHLTGVFLDDWLKSTGQKLELDYFSHLTGVFLDDWLKSTGQKLESDYFCIFAI